MAFYGMGHGLADDLNRTEDKASNASLSSAMGETQRGEKGGKAGGTRRQATDSITLK